MEGQLAHIGAGLAGLGTGLAALGVGNVAANFLAGALRSAARLPRRRPRPCSSASHSPKHWASSPSSLLCC